jgi:hypothetical protein
MSLVLPASGAALCWLLMMTLWLPLLDFGRSYAPLVVKVRSMMGPTDCVHFHGLTKAQGAAFEYHGQLRLKPAHEAGCAWLIVDTQAVSTLPQAVDFKQWTQHATVRRPSDKNEDIVLYRRSSSVN